MQPHPSPPALVIWPDHPSALPACCWMTECIGVQVGKHGIEAHHAQEKPNHDSRAPSPLSRQPLSSGQRQTSSLPPTGQSLLLHRLFLIRLFYCNISSLPFLHLPRLSPISSFESTHPFFSGISLPVPHVAPLNRAKEGSSHHKTEIINDWLRSWHSERPREIALKVSSKK